MTKQIQNLINHYENRLKIGRLCSVGQERLKWWKANGEKFKTIREALLTWKVSQIHAYLNDAGINIPDSIVYEYDHSNANQGYINYLTGLRGYLGKETIDRIIEVLQSVGVDTDTDTHKWIANTNNRVTRRKK